MSDCGGTCVRVSARRRAPLAAVMRVLVLALLCACVREGRCEVPRAEGPESRITSIAREAEANIEERLGLSLTKEVAIYICGSEEDMAAVTGSRPPFWALAVARPADGVIAVNRRRVQGATRNDISIAIRHEMAHVIMGEIRKGPPRWFEEGVAEVVSGRLVGRSSDELVMAAKWGRLIPLKKLEREWPSGPGEAGLAYAQAGSVVMRLVSLRGWKAVRTILGDMKEGRPFEEAFRDGAGVSRAEFEREWRMSLRKEDVVFKVLTLVLRPPYLYTAMAMLAVVAAGVYLVRRKKILARLEREEPWS